MKRLKNRGRKTSRSCTDHDDIEPLVVQPVGT
jgi:hypothetical protein